MPRNRIIYQSEAVYAGPSPATGFHFGTFTPGIGGSSNDLQNTNNLVNQLQRVQTANYSFNVARTDVNQFGQLAAIDRVILTSPTVSLDFSYILANLSNEVDLGFTVVSGSSDSNISAISGFLNATQDERNYFIRTASEGNDAVGFSDLSSGNNGVIGIGNAFISSYSTEGSVGNFPTASISVEGSNMTFQQGLSGNFVPAINPTDGLPLRNFYTLPLTVQNTAIGSGNAISALRPGDITLNIESMISGGGGVDTSTMNIQSYNLSFDLGRTPIEKLGNKFAFAKPVDFPLTVNLSVDAQVTDMVTGNLASLLVDDSYRFSPSVTIKSPTDRSLVMAKFALRGAKVISQEFSSDIGSNKTVTLTFESQVGGPQDTANGLFINGQF
jgi:hypothetical protein